MSKILIAGDNALIRMAVSLLIKDTVENATTTECTNFDEMKSMLKKKKFDLLIMDIAMPNANNFKMIKLLCTSRPELEILILSPYNDIEHPVRFLKAGVNGYVDKTALPDQVRKAIISVLNHERYISPAVIEHMLEVSNMKEPKTPDPVLSKRERQVLNLVTNGLSTTTIAVQLGVTVQTISTLKNRIFKKMQVSNTFQLRDKVKALL